MAIRQLAGRRVLVSGAASGIGLATAQAFAAAGCRVAITDVAEQALEQARGTIGADCLAVPCDISRPDQVAHLAGKVTETFGALDVLVNNAGIGFLGDFLHTPPAAWERIVGINLLGMVQMTRAFLPGMLAHGGDAAVVNVASALGFTAGPCLSAYSATKHAVVGLSESLGMELAGTRVSVSIIAPGIIDTAIVKSPAGLAETIDDGQLAQIQKYYREKGCQPEVVANDIIAAVLRGRRIVPSGPLARAMVWMPRISRRLMRAMSLSGAKDVGYWR